MRWLIAALAALLAAFGLAWFSGAFYRPGAGAAYQSAPDAVAAGAQAEIGLRLAVWGAGGPAAPRYEDVRLSIGALDAPGWQTLTASKVVNAAEGVSYVFTFKAPDHPGAVLGYRFSFVFDGRPSTVEGLKRLVVE